VLALILMFPMTLMLPAAAVTAWRRWREPGVRFALAWLIPTWLVFEALPTKLVHYPLPVYGAVAWLAAAALTEPLGKRTRWTGAALAGLFGLLLAVGTFFLVRRYGDLSDIPFAILAGGLLAAAGLVGGYLLVRRAPAAAVVGAVGLGLAGHAALAAGLAPRLSPLWLSARIQRVMEKAQLLPEQGIARRRRRGDLRASSGDCRTAEGGRFPQGPFALRRAGPSGGHGEGPRLFGRQEDDPACL
jgi:4-amino-4-deoxy-L-arabinose transferase-like glycosyltransferase